MSAYNRAEPSHGLPRINIPESYNYIGVFLTLRCNLRCSYCINRFGSMASPRRMLSAAEWVQGLNRIQNRPGLPLTLQGGEPSLHPGFYEIIAGLRADLQIDLLTNLQFDIGEFMARVAPERLSREAPYASIRVSYHPETMVFDELQGKVLRLLEGGYSVGIWAVDHPAGRRELALAKEKCLAAGIDFRFKEFLGGYQGQLYGTYSYPRAISGRWGGEVQCRTTELLLDPGGDIHRCHSFLYAGRTPVGNLLEPGFRIDEGFCSCDYFGECNPCDVKTKNNRFQQFGHTSVEIRLAEDLVKNTERGEEKDVEQPL